MEAYWITVTNAALFILIPFATEQIIEHIMHVIFIQETKPVYSINVLSGFL